MILVVLQEDELVAGLRVRRAPPQVLADQAVEVVARVVAPAENLLGLSEVVHADPAPRQPDQRSVTVQLTEEVHLGPVVLPDRPRVADDRAALGLTVDLRQSEVDG